MTLFDMSGKVAVITGSSRGIGRAIAERMAEHGAKVVISSRKQQVCDEVAKAINDKAGKQVALAVAANISTKDDLKNLVEETNRVFGKIDTLVCNAASNPITARRPEFPTISFARFSTTTSSPITG
jgi:NAD(P)-dependent dehydrogenase (short-subunit alcohol dehydrogenase family)